MPSHLRYLLANHRRRERVTRNGIRIVWGGQSHFYCNADTGRLQGQEVLVWFDPEECPRSITITDLDRRNPVEVPKLEALPSMTATKNQLRTAHAQVGSHLAHARTLYRIIQPHFTRSMFRPVLVDAATVEVGRQITTAREQVQSVAQQKKAVSSRISKKERELGVGIRADHRNPERKLEGLERVQRFMAAAREEEATS